MGCVESKSDELLKQEKQNKAVEQQLKKSKGDFLSEIKLLLLGIFRFLDSVIDFGIS